MRMAGRSRMNREVHVRFCEGLGVKFPRATRPNRRWASIADINNKNQVSCTLIFCWYCKHITARTPAELSAKMTWIKRSIGLLISPTSVYTAYNTDLFSLCYVDISSNMTKKLVAIRLWYVIGVLWRWSRIKQACSNYSKEADIFYIPKSAGHTAYAIQRLLPQFLMDGVAITTWDALLNRFHRNPFV